MDADRMTSTTAGQSPVPLGFRSNNPGNLRPGAQKWLGEVDPDPRGYCRFDSMPHGIRALAKNLIAYQTVHTLTTIGGMIARWAPPSENDTPAYVATVCLACGVDQDATYDVSDAANLQALTRAIIVHENGQRAVDAYLSDEDVAEGVTEAFA